jgi:hypothetical protein
MKRRDAEAQSKPFKNVINAKSSDGAKYRCPCCNYRTLDERGGFDICQVCFWEDDGQDSHDADETRGGPNGILSLSQAQRNFQLFKAADKRFISNVRPPLPDEI